MLSILGLFLHLSAGLEPSAVLPLVSAVSLIIAARTLKHGATELTGWVPKVHESETWQIVCPEAEDVTVEMNGCIGVADYQREMIDHVAEH